ncbi:hypothetical protein PoB_006509800 [Plakobranchus ocellatus]|uniref:Uncharacterized protein n=1 Tax=Plakobranchus ocellatus TaxID=259542 RepID=A0AAV4D346_9GAST|nr:hypothetical protein PoB_006509800 [Plakobranchus ocellatus]
MAEIKNKLTKSSQDRSLIALRFPSLIAILVFYTLVLHEFQLHDRAFIEIKTSQITCTQKISKPLSRSEATSAARRPPSPELLLEYTVINIIVSTTTTTAFSLLPTLRPAPPQQNCHH